MATSLLDPPEPAPSRGQYDRSLSRLERQQRQRDRVLYWTVREFYARGAGLTVSHIVEAAGTGRNTFYEYFDDLENALDASGQWCAKRLEQLLHRQLEVARTPIARLKILSAAWFQALDTDPAEFAVLVWQRPSSDHDALTHAAQLFLRLLGVALGQAKLEQSCASVPHLDVAVAQAVVGLTSWSMTAGVAARDLEAPARAILLDVFR